MIKKMDEYLSIINSLFQNYQNIVIVIKGSPDPDAIASAFFFLNLGKKLQKNIQIVYYEKISLPQNLLFVELLSIPMTEISNDFDWKKFDGYIITDHQSVTADYIPLDLPCLLHIDHHQVISQTLQPVYRILDTNINSVSSLLALMMKQNTSYFHSLEKKSLFTALYYGIMTDTDFLSIGNKNDKEAIDFLFSHMDDEIYQKIQIIQNSNKIKGIYQHAYNNLVRKNNWIFSGVGYIDASNRDQIAIAADSLLKEFNVSAVVVYALIENHEKKTLHLDASFRVKKKSSLLNLMIKRITNNGGASKYKGAFQYSLDFFYDCEDKIQFWDIISKSTIKNILDAEKSVSRKGIGKFYHYLTKYFKID